MFSVQKQGGRLAEGGQCWPELDVCAELQPPGETMKDTSGEFNQTAALGPSNPSPVLPDASRRNKAKIVTNPSTK